MQPVFPWWCTLFKSESLPLYWKARVVPKRSTMVVVLLIGLARRSDTQCDCGELYFLFLHIVDQKALWNDHLFLNKHQYSSLSSGKILFVIGFPEETISVCLICGYIELHYIQYVLLFIPGSLIELSSFLSMLIINKRSVSLCFKAETIFATKKTIINFFSLNLLWIV